MDQTKRKRASRILAFVFGGFIALAGRSDAAVLSLTGITEGSIIVLPSSAVATNLSISASISGGVGTSEVVFALERQGLPFKAATSSPPYTVVFANLGVGKYFLSASTTSAQGLAGDLSFDVVAATPEPINNRFSDALAISGFGGVITGSNARATMETSEPGHADNGGGRSVWWLWRASSNGIVTMTTSGSTFDTVLAAYTGTNVSNLGVVAANDDAGISNGSSQVTFTAIAGTDYHIAVDGALSPDGTAATGNIRLRILPSAPPAIAISSPANGLAMLVPNSSAPTNISVATLITAASGIARVDYYFDGPSLSRAGSVSPPYQWALNDLTSGDYLLTVSSRDNDDLVSTAHTGFRVVSTAPQIALAGTQPSTPSGLELALFGVKGLGYELQSSTNLFAWSRFALWTNFDGVQRVADSNAVYSDRRFYRIISR